MGFSLGQVVMTIGIAEHIKEEKGFSEFVYDSIRRHSVGDFNESDMKANIKAIINGDRVFSVFHKDEWEIYIITEWDRSYTTILLPNEY